MATELTGERCDACHKDSPRVTDEQLAELSRYIPDWELLDDGGVLKLQRTFRFTSYPAVLAFMQKVGAAAEEQGHHPQMVVEARRARVVWWTHAIGWLHRNDFIMAASTDEIYAGSEGKR